MVSSSKILTVSYGTFSCTLEGFDNSFDAMKAIAEYFRDLAQDDRYFGAEPPTPDTEMLARIAEREIERRVEARFEQGNLVLRPTDEAEPPQGDVAPEPTSGAAVMGAAAGAAAAGLAAVALQGDEAEEIRTDLPPTEGGDAEDIELDLSNLSFELEDDVEDTFVAPDEPAVDVMEDVSAPVEVDEAVDAEADLDAAPLVDEAAAEEHITEEIAEDTAEDDIVEVADDFDVGTSEEAETAVETDHDDVENVADEVTEEAFAEVEEVEETLPAQADTVADKLERIRAVVASKSQEEPEYIEDEHAMPGLDGDGDDENDAMESVVQMPGLAEPTELMSDDLSELDGDLDDDEENLFADTIAAIVNDEVADAEVVDADMPDESDADSVPDEDLSDTEAELEMLRAKIAELEAQASAVEAPAEVEEEDVVAEVDAVDDDIADDTDEDEDIVEATEEVEGLEDAQEPIVAHVQKAKRADVEAALAAGDFEEVEDDEDVAPTAEEHAVPGSDDSSLTPEQEQELAQELADLQAEIDSDDDWDFDVEDEKADETDDNVDSMIDEVSEEAEANVRKAVKMSNPARAMLTDSSIEEDDGSVERLIDQAETEMDEPEGNRRRSAIAHLRAAVAATKADRLLGIGRKKAEEEEEPYREDLADAVRPRRPTSRKTRSERPAPVRPAPLQLVAEQRVDASEEPVDEAEPVRPRRVTRAEPTDAAEDAFANDTGFAEYAESQGAHSLPELLEAAASYMSFVEGREQFSRPQLMTKLHQAEGETSSREERLRSFGQLLRDGKIEKKGGGRFTASDNIGFKPAERAAG